MAKVKLTKTELKARTDALKRFQRFLPMLQLKKQQLQAEIAAITAKADEVAAKEQEVLDSVGNWVGLLATDEKLVDGLVKVVEIQTSQANIAGVAIPTFESIVTETKTVDKWATPAWVDSAAGAIVEILTLKSKRAVYERQRELVSEELQLTSQRVNLFEKVKIPECREAIRVIKIALGDEQAAAVTRGKIAKSRTPAQSESDCGEEVA
jgi:V/A-type H+-transporting ATPase subunit D